ncbi:MAG: hypothetical protein IJ588_09055 [Prevotella sp.]|nr:hypothetical protein [Prevotella sp.]
MVKQSKTAVSAVTDGVVLCQDGKYRWIYEVDMLRSPIIFHDVVWVLAVSAGVAWLITTFIILLTGSLTLMGFLESIAMFIGIFLLLTFLSVFAYWIVAVTNGRKYTVLFEMDEQRISHIQIKRNVKPATVLTWMGILTGALAGRPGAVGASILSATHTSLTSSFATTRSVTAVPRQHLIKVNGLLSRNRIFVDEAHFQFVYDYIASRCPKAKIR